jgi:hypothetical protein
VPVSETPARSHPSYARPPAPGTSHAPQPANLADILERVLDKGIIIAGDIKVNLLDIELLTIKIRLLVASVDKAQEMGIDWWRNDPMLSSRDQSLAEENKQLRERVAALERGQGSPDTNGNARGNGGDRADSEDGGEEAAQHDAREAREPGGE